MRVTIQTLCFLGVLANTISSPLPGEPILDLEVIARMTPQELDELAGGLAAEELIRTKRSGSGDILGTVSKSITSGLGSKIGLIASASAGATSLISSASSASSSKGHVDHGYGYGPAPSTKFDFWSLKKSILNTLFQAVKAISGGVTILNGQFIKGGGALASGVGKLISIKGDAVTNLGRHIVSSATLVPPKKKHLSVPVPIHVTGPAHISASGPIHGPSGPSIPVSSYGPPTAPAHFSSPSGPGHYPSGPGHFSPASAPSHFYGPSPSHNSILSGVPSKYSHPYEGNVKPSGLHAGIFLLHPLEGDSTGANNHDNQHAPSGPPASFVSSALQALKGILGGATEGSAPTAHSAPIAHSVHAPSAPSSEYKDPIFHPPPPLTSSGASYSSYALQNNNELPPFKPLDSTSNHDKKPSSLLTSYGTPISYDTDPRQSLNLQTMVDHLAESQLNHLGLMQNSPSFNEYLDSFPDSQTGYSQKQNNAAPIPGPLNLSELNKITKYHKVQQRSDNQLLDGSARISRMDIIKEMAKSAAIDELIANLKFVTTTKAPERNEEQIERKTTHSVTVDKSVSYELRGNRVVRLTDNIGDA